MQRKRSTLTLGAAGSATREETTPLPSILKIAISRRQCVRASYNRTAIEFAPHALYTRHDEPFVDGVVLKRDGAAPKELKLGTFKLAGLGNVGLSPDSFEANAVFDAAAERYVGTLIASVAA